MRALIIFLLISFAAPTVFAGDFGCKCILCLASPGGPMQYEDCRPTIEKLYDMLYRREPFPDCQEAEANGVKTKNGVEPWEPCNDGYDVAIEEEDYGGGSTRVCRKFVGYKEVQSYGEGSRKIPVYDQYTQKMRPKPHYVEVWHEGELKGERFWYKIKRKK